MARIARVVAPGIPHQVTQRGNWREQTFFNDEDYQAYLGLMSEIGIKQDLEERLGSKVDIVSYRPTMNLFLKRWIDNEVVYA